ncbi:MAG: winged helix-turn-helix domain-containing protein [Prevotella sp.]|nr:winged helix-turn-helix domain-containing protein [Prevotella sp.]
METKKVTTKTTATKAAAAKRTTARKACARKSSEVAINAQNIGFKAGDVYNALAAADKALSVKEIAKAAQISANEVLVGLGWLFKEGKVAGQEDNKVVLA